MLIIVNITTNRLTASTTSKTCYMLDFNEVFWHADNADKTRKKNTRITADSKIFFADALRRGRRILNADAAARRGRHGNFTTRTRRGADADYLPTYEEISRHKLMQIVRILFVRRRKPRRRFRIFLRNWQSSLNS